MNWIQSSWTGGIFTVNQSPFFYSPSFSKSQDNVGREKHGYTHTGPVKTDANLQRLSKIAWKRIKTAWAERNDKLLGSSSYPVMSQHFLSSGFWLGSQVQHNAPACSILAKTDCNHAQAPLLFPYSAKTRRRHKKNWSVYISMWCVHICVYRDIKGKQALSVSELWFSQMFPAWWQRWWFQHYMSLVLLDVSKCIHPMRQQSTPKYVQAGTKRHSRKNRISNS